MTIALVTKASPLDKQELIKQVAEKRCRKAFGQLFEHYAPQLKAFSLARDPGAYLVADELVQDVLIKVWNKADKYDPTKANLNTWIFTLARNSRIDYLRRNGRFAKEVEADDLFDSIVDESSDPFESTAQRKVQQRIQAGLAELPQEQSQVLRKVYIEGKTHQESAAELRLPLGTVKSRVRLALQKLEVLMGEFR